MEIKRIAPLSLGKLMGALYGAMGLFLGAIFALLSLVGAGVMAAEGEGPAWVGALFGIGAIVIAPLFYGLMAFVMGLVVAALYNLASRLVGGIQFEVE